MIEVVSYPIDLSTWHPQEPDNSFYIELYGETRPLIALDFAEILPPSSNGNLPQSKTQESLPIYEYSWTIGHSGNLSSDLLKNLQDPAAKVFLYFPISRGWRVKELLATVHYLRPVPEQGKWLQMLSEHWQEVSPLVKDVSSLSGLIPNAPFPEVASILSTIAKLQINSIPQVEGFVWSVSKVTHISTYGLMQGIEWTIPREMFKELGSRLTGSVAVSFIPSLIQQNYAVGDEDPKLQFQAGTVLACANILGHQGKEPSIYKLPPSSQNLPTNCIELQIAPYRKEAHNSQKDDNKT